MTGMEVMCIMVGKFLSSPIHNVRMQDPMSEVKLLSAVSAPAAPVAVPELQRKKPRIVPLLSALALLSGAAFFLATRGLLGAPGSWILETFNFPAAVVGSRVISYQEFVSDRRALTHYAREMNIATDMDINGQVLERLRRNVFIRTAAAHANISVSNEEVEAMVRTLVPGNSATMAAQVKELFGWGMEDFEKNIIEPFLLEQKLQAAFSDGQIKSVYGDVTLEEYLAKKNARTRTWRLIKEL